MTPSCIGLDRTPGDSSRAVGPALDEPPEGVPDRPLAAWSRANRIAMGREPEHRNQIIDEEPANGSDAQID